MLILKYVFLIFIGLASGVLIAGGYVALISMLGVIPRFAGITKTAKRIMLYENCMILGVILGNVVDLYDIFLPFGYPLLALQGFFGGVFIGALAVSLAETVKIIPVFSRRVKVRKGMPYLVFAYAFGKTMGTIIQYFIIN